MSRVVDKAVAAAWACCVAWGLAGGNVAHAQAGLDAPLRAIEEGLRRQDERVRQSERPPVADVLRPAPQPSGVLGPWPAETPCFAVEQAELVGPDAARFAWLLANTGLDAHPCLGVQGIGRLVSGLNQRLIDRGFATSRVSLPEQNLSSGRLVLQLHAGRIDAVEVRNPEPSTAAAPALSGWRMAFPLVEGGILNIRDIEQGVEQARRLPSTSTAVRLEPGTTPDTSRVVIDRNTPTLMQRLRGGTTLDNSGTGALGRTQVSGNLSLDDPFGFDDLLGLSVNSNAERPSASHRSQSLAGYYSIPWGYDTFTVSASQSRFAQYVQGTTARFLSSGSSATAEARWQRVVWRSEAAKFGVQAAVSMRRAQSFLDDVEVLVQRRRTTAAELGVSYKHLWSQSVFDGELNYRRGVPWGGAQEDLIGAAEGGPTLRPRIWTFAASFATPVALPSFLSAGSVDSPAMALQYSMALRGQYSPDTTLSVDQLAIGGRGSVRGFTGDTVLLAESGFYMRNELSGALPPQWDIGLQWFAALDLGRVSGPSTVMLPGRQLVGAAAGVRGRTKALVLEATVGAPLYRPAGFRGRALVPMLSLSYLF